jgi:hypothetical protein
MQWPEAEHALRERVTRRASARRKIFPAASSVPSPRALICSKDISRRLCAGLALAGPARREGKAVVRRGLAETSRVCASPSCAPAAAGRPRRDHRG